MHIIIVILGFVLSSMVQAESLQNILEKYSKAKSLQFDIKKTDEKMTLGTKSEIDGVLKYQKGQIYLIQRGEKKVEVFYANKTLTLVEHPDVDFNPDGKRKVTVLKKNTSPLIKSLLGLFSNPKNFVKTFPVKEQKEQNGVLTLGLNSKLQNIKNLTLKINSKDSELKELSFIDEVDTKTTLNFLNVKYNTKIDGADFRYKIQKTDEVVTQ